jgi:hypothetical protein
MSCTGGQTANKAEDEKSKLLKRLQEQTHLSLKLLNIVDCAHFLGVYKEYLQHPYVVKNEPKNKGLQLNYLLCDVYINTKSTGHKHPTKKDAKMFHTGDTILIFQPLYKNRLYLSEDFSHIKNFKHRVSYTNIYIKFTASDTVTITDGRLDTYGEYSKSNPETVYTGIWAKGVSYDGKEIRKFSQIKPFLSEQKLTLFWGDDKRVLEKWYSPYHYFLYRQWFSTENTIPVVAPEENYEYSIVSYFWGIYQYGWIERRQSLHVQHLLPDQVAY